MERLWTSELRAHAGERVRVAGWLQHQRQLSRLTFALVRDARGLAQAVFEDEAEIARLELLLPETVLAVEGLVAEVPQAPGGIELHEPAFEVISEPVERPSLELRRPQLKEQLPTILDHAAVALRHPRERAKFEVAAASIAGYREALDTLGFTEIQTPKLVGAGAEGGANVFRVDYFGRPAFLAQSPQLYKQIMVGVFERVYETGPVFRAEPHDTSRHLAEYVSLDAEIGFVEDHRDVMRFARAAVAGMARRATPALAALALEPPELPREIPVLHFEEAQRLIERATGESLAGEPDLAPAHERRLGEWARREHRSDFLFVERYPMEKRPFYTHPAPGRPELSNSFDLLFRGMELMTGGQRLHRYEDYVAAIEERGLSLEPFEGFLDAYRYAMPPHGGWGMGLERWTASLVGAGNLRETTLFPRDLNRLAP